MNNQAQDLLAKKKKRAINIVKFYSYFTEFLMYGYGGFFIYNFFYSPNTELVFATFFFNMLIVISCALLCETCRKKMRNAPPNYPEAKSNLGSGVCLLFLFAVFYIIASVGLYFLSSGYAFWLCIIILVLASPYLLLGFIGLIIIKNFSILMTPDGLTKGLQPQSQSGLSINNGGGVNDDLRA